MDAAELGRLMVLGEGCIRDVVDPLRVAVAMMTDDDGDGRSSSRSSEAKVW